MNDVFIPTGMKMHHLWLGCFLSNVNSFVTCVMSKFMFFVSFSN